MRAKKSKNFGPGQSVIEYGLIGMLVVVVGIGGLFLLQSQFQSSLSKQQKILAQFNQSAINKTLPYSTLSTSSPSPSPPIASSVGVKALSFTTSKGQLIQVQNFPTDMAKLIETGGVSGATETTLAVLENLIKQLLATEEITPTQANSLKEMANAGYNIARNQKMIENFIAQNPGLSWGELNSLPFEINNRVSRIQTALDQSEAAFSQNTISNALQNDTLETLVPNNNYQVNYKNFILNYGRAKQDGSLDNSIIKTIVNELTATVLTTSKTFSDTLYAHDATPITNLNTEVSNLYSQKTIVSSTGICTTGNGTSKNLNCS